MDSHLNNKWSTCNNSNNYFKIRSSNYLIDKSKYIPINSIYENVLRLSNEFIVS